MQAVVLAAGLGTRLRPLTNDKPKALVQLGSKPLLEHVLDSLGRAGVAQTIVVTGKSSAQIEQFFGNRFDPMDLTYVRQNKALGTGDALLQAREAVQKEFLVGHCDVMAPPATWQNLQQIKGFDCVMALRKETHPEQFGVVVTNGGLVADVIEKPDKAPTDLVNAGCYKFTDKIFGALEKTKPSVRGEYELTDAIKILMQQKKVGYYLEKQKIWDIATLQELNDAQNEIGEREIKW